MGNITIGDYAEEIIAALAADLAARAMGESPSKWNFADYELPGLLAQHGDDVIGGLRKRLPKGLREAIVRQVKLLKNVKEYFKDGETLERPPGTAQLPLGPLEQALFAQGGTRVLRQGEHDPHAADLLARGRLFTLPVRMRPGEPHRCHTNAAGLWAEDVQRYTLVTGYALARDTWVQHCWVVDEKRLYDTIRLFKRYFGVALTPQEAIEFWCANYLKLRYPGPVALMWPAERGGMSVTAQG